MRYLLRFSLLFFVAQVGFANDMDCQAEYRKRLQTDLELSYEEFDQTEGKGMRVLAYAGCAKEAADLVVAYIKKNDAKQSSLFWHVAQQRASDGDNAEAVIYARLSLAKEEDWSKRPLRWNDYVLATIAFLEKDKAKFLLHRERVAQGKDLYFGNAMNLKLLDGMLVNFEKSYRQATMGQ